MEVPKRAVSEADLHDWSQHRILPYLDLTFWAEVEGVALTQQLLGEVLFPREYGVNLAERIRKTVAPLARKVVTYDFCNYLVVQVLEELRATGKIRLLPDEAKGVGAEGGLSPSRVARLFPDMKGEE
jgi:hypothetical protein